MTTIDQRARELDRRGILAPRVFHIDMSYEAFACAQAMSDSKSLSQMAKAGKDFEPVREWIRELHGAQCPELWNVFVHRKGRIGFAQKHEDISVEPIGSAYTSFIERSAKDGRDKLSTRLVYSTTDNVKGLDDIQLFHELGHMIDDQIILAGDRQCVMGFHSENPTWRFLTKLDKEITPEGGVQQIEWDRRDSGYLTTMEEWPGEVFAEAVNRHMGPRRTKAEHRITYLTLEKVPAIYSPFLQAYMDSIVAIDIAIQSQDKSYMACQNDRKKLKAALAQPLEAYFDMDGIRELTERIKNTQNPAVRNVATDELAAAIQVGMQRMTEDVAAELGIQPPKAPSRQR